MSETDDSIDVGEWVERILGVSEATRLDLRHQELAEELVCQLEDLGEAARVIATLVQGMAP